MFALSVPCVLGFNLIPPLFEIGGEGKVIMDVEDFIVSNVLLPLGSLIFVIFCTSRYGWGWKKFTAEANEGKGLKVANWMRPYVAYVLPVIVFALFVIGVLAFFGIDVYSMIVNLFAAA